MGKHRPLSFQGHGWYGAAMRAVPILIALLCLTACGKPDNAPGPGGVSVGEAKALDEAAAMLEEERLPDAAIQPVQSKMPAAPVPAAKAPAPAR